MAGLGALQIDRPGQAFVTIERTAGDARNLFVIDHGLAVLHDGDVSAYKSYIKALPLTGLARQLRRRRDETVHTAGVMAGWLINRVGFYLHFIAATQIDSA